METLIDRYACHFVFVNVMIYFNPITV